VPAAVPAGHGAYLGYSIGWLTDPHPGDGDALPAQRSWSASTAALRDLHDVAVDTPTRPVLQLGRAAPTGQRLQHPLKQSLRPWSGLGQFLPVSDLRTEQRVLIWRRWQDPQR